MGADSRIESLLAGKPPEIQNRLRKTIYEARLGEDDALWTFLELLDVYGSEIQKNAALAEENAERSDTSQETFKKELRASLSRQFKQIRDVSLAKFTSTMSEEADQIVSGVTEARGEMNRLINENLIAAKGQTRKKIREYEFEFSQEVEKEIGKIIKVARENRVHPTARMIAFLFNMTMLCGLSLGFAVFFMAVGYEAALGNSGFIVDFFSGVMNWIKTPFS